MRWFLALLAADGAMQPAPLLPPSSSTNSVRPDGRATVLYGTALRNRPEVRPSVRGLELMREAGMDGAALAAMTIAPMTWWKWPLQTFEPNAEATFLVLDADPRVDADAVVTPREVWLRGERLR